MSPKPSSASAAGFLPLQRQTLSDLTLDAAPDFIYPFASAIDTPLPEPPERVHVFTSEAPAWAGPPSGPRELAVERNTNESIEGWHRRHGLTTDE